jgi:hypothetical protein
MKNQLEARSYRTITCTANSILDGISQKNLFFVLNENFLLYFVTVNNVMIPNYTMYFSYT